MGVMDELMQDFDLRDVGPTTPPEPMDLSGSQSALQAPAGMPEPDGGRDRPQAPPSDLPHAPRSRRKAHDDDRLQAAVEELQDVLSEVQMLKARASSVPDWKAVMLHVALVKPRISELRAMAKAMYVRHFGGAFEQHYTPGGSRSGGSNLKMAESRAKSDASLSYEVAERFDKTWHDLEHLLWSIKSVAEGMENERDNPQFDARPDHLFTFGISESRSHDDEG